MSCALGIDFILVLFFFFFKQKTAYEMRISDWSSDVCSSDLASDPSLRPRWRPPGFRSPPWRSQRRLRLRMPSAGHPHHAVSSPPSSDLEGDRQAYVEPVRPRARQCGQRLRPHERSKCLAVELVEAGTPFAPGIDHAHAAIHDEVDPHRSDERRVRKECDS